MPRRPGSPPTLAPTLPTIHLARDHTAADVRARVRTGAWVPVRRGAYLAPSGLPAGADARLRDALARILAVDATRTADVTFSHTTAALLWGLPLLAVDPAVHVTQSTRPTGRDRDVRRHVHRLPPEHRTVRLGLSVTTPERTLVDCVTTLGPRAGLVVADAALRAGVERDACAELLRTRAGHRGVVTARAVLELADDGAESPGESLARFVLLRAGLPRPQTQVRVETHLGTFWSDLGWPEWRLLAEYDGRTKYGARGSASEAVIAEKRRQEAVEETGYRVLRITKEDVAAPARLLARVRRLAPPGLGLTPRPALRRPG